MKTKKGWPRPAGKITRKRSKRDPNKLRLNLVENGIDFIRRGVSQFFLHDDAPAIDHKYAVIHTFAGTLLVMKARLAKEHSSLIYAKVEKSGPGANTVNFSELLERLKNCADINFTEDELTVLEDAQKLRNKIEHYEVDIDLKETKQVIGQLTEFVTGFLRRHLNKRLEDQIPYDVWERIQSLRAVAHGLKVEIEQLRKKHLRLPTEKLAEMGHEASDWCPRCFSYTLVDRSLKDRVFLCTNPACRGVLERTWCWMCGRPCPALPGIEILCSDCGYFHIAPDEDEADGSEPAS